MTSSSPELRRAAPRVALVIVGALVAVGLTAGLERTTATLSDQAAAASTITTRAACVGDAARYTSGMLDSAHPVLRWSFTDGLPKDLAPAPAETTVAATAVAVVPAPVSAPTEAAPTDTAPDATVTTRRRSGHDHQKSTEVAPAPTTATTTPEAPAPAQPEPTPEPALVPVLAPAPAPATGGLLVCDPAQIAQPSTTAAGGSVSLPGGTGSGLRSKDLALEGPVTLLLWFTAERPGELASLTADGAGLVIAVTGDSIVLTTPDGTAEVPFTADGRPHLVAVHSEDGAAGVTLDGVTTTGSTTRSSELAGTYALTVGARASADSAVGRVDEVTLLTGTSDGDLAARLVAADRWWVPGAVS